MDLINAELERFQVDFATNKEQPGGDLFEEALRLDSGSHNLQTRANTVGSSSLLNSLNKQSSSPDSFEEDSFNIDEFEEDEQEELFEETQAGQTEEPF